MAVVRIIYHQEEQGWWAISPDMPGLVIAGDSAEEVRALAEEGLAEEGHTAEHLAADGSLVFATPAQAQFHDNLADTAGGIVMLTRMVIEGNRLTEREAPLVVASARVDGRD